MTTVQAVFALAALVVTLSLLGGCSPYPEPNATEPTVTRREPTLTAERAKEALLDRMRTKSGDFTTFDPKEWAKVVLRAEEGGWYDFGGLFRINPSKKAYTMLIRPSPEVKACSFECEGTFSFKEGKWVADSPKIVRTALGGGK